MFKKTDLLFLILALHLSACSVPSKLDKDSPKNWSMWGGNYAGTRYSPLQEINSDNVQRLKLLWAFPTKIAGGHEGGPLIVDNIIYIHTPFPNRVYALDQKTRQEIWQYTPDQSAAKGLSEIWAKSNSGLAYANGKLFLQQNDTTLTALDATTGKVLWQTKNGDPKKGMSNSNAPIVIKNKVITGISDTFYGARGFLAAYDINTGTLIWKGYSTGADKDTLIKAGYTTWREGQVTPLDKDESLASWQAEQWKTGGGTTEGWYSYDPELNLVYYGSSRPAPGNPVQRPGDNKWTSALWARDADTGIVKWVYQMTPHDEWGYDGYNESVLLDQTINGKVRKTLVHFDENGFVYILDRASGELLSAKKFDPKVNWATHIDLFSGQPQRVIKYSPAHQEEDEFTTGICPSSYSGSKNKNPVSYSPNTNLFYVARNRFCMDIEHFEVTYTKGHVYFGIGGYYLHAYNKYKGVLSAWDAKQGKQIWAIEEPLPILSGSLATAGNLVFYGTYDGYLKAVDAKTGKLLYQFKTPSGIIGNINTWQYQGKQYISVLSGVGGFYQFEVNYSTAATSVLSVFAIPDSDSDLQFSESYPRDLFVLDIHNNPEYTSKWLSKFNPEQISTQVHKWIKQIAFFGDVTSPYGFLSSIPQYENYLGLKRTASNAELLELTQHPNAAVRFYAFLVLTDRPAIKLKPILLDHLNDEEVTGYQSGCEIWSLPVNDLLLEAAEQDSDFFNQTPRRNRLSVKDYQEIKQMQDNLKQQKSAIKNETGVK